MKHKAKNYAKALAGLILEKKNKQEQKKVVSKFLKYLEKNGDIKKAKEIVSLAENLYFKKTGKRKIILETARKTDTKDVSKKIFKKGDFLEEKVNSELVAGIKIMVNNEKQLDFSLKSKLDRIFSA